MMSQLIISHISILKNYHDSVYQALSSSTVSNRLVEEIETFVLAHRQHWSSSDLPVLISLSSRLKKLTGNRSSISTVMDSILVLKDGPQIDQARQALYQLFSKVLEKKESFQNQDFVEISRLWAAACSSEKLLGNGEVRAILHKLQFELSEVTDEAAVQLLNEIRTLLENCPKVSLNLNQKVQGHFQKSLLALLEQQAKKQLEEIGKDPVLSCEEKEQAMDTCEAQTDQKLASLDQDVLECMELVGDCFSFAAASDVAFAALNLEAQQFLFQHGFEMHKTMEEKFPFLKERQYYPELMKRVEKRLRSMELNWNPFPVLVDKALLNIASYLPSADLHQWVASHRFLHDYFKGSLFCEDITSCASSREYQETLDRQHACLREMHKGSRYAWACQMGERIKGLSLKRPFAETIDLDQLLEKCPNLVALDLRGINLKKLPLNILQLKFLVLPQGLWFDIHVSLLNFLGFKQDAEDPKVFMRDSVMVDGNALSIEMGDVEFNPSYLLSPSLERLTLTGYWGSFKLTSFFTQLKERCPNLQYLDAGNASGICFRLFHLDLTWIKGLEFSKSYTIDLLKVFFSLLRTCGLVMVRESKDNQCHSRKKNHITYVWERVDFVPKATLKLKRAEILPSHQYVALSQLYPRLEKLSIGSKEYWVETPPAIWNLISPTTEIEILDVRAFSLLQTELQQLGFLSKKNINDWNDIPPTIVWTNPRDYFTIKEIGLDRLDVILKMSPKSSKIGLLFLDISPSSKKLEELPKLKNILSKHGIDTLQIDRVKIHGQYIKELPSLLDIVPQVTVTEVELHSLPESTQLADIAPFLQQQQVEKLQFTGCKNSSKANQLL
jgi:hypothetical protein